MSPHKDAQIPFRLLVWNNAFACPYEVMKEFIHAGGDVYNLDNMVIVTPRMHQEILDKQYHFGH